MRLLILSLVLSTGCSVALAPSSANSCRSLAAPTADAVTATALGITATALANRIDHECFECNNLVAGLAAASVAALSIAYGASAAHGLEASSSCSPVAD